MRENDGARAAAVIEARDDRPQMLAALKRLWLESPEHDGFDAHAADAWQAVVQANAVDDAVAAGLELVRARKRFRIYAFVDVTENVSDEVLVELAGIVLEAGWSPDPYLAAVFMRIAEHRYEKAFWKIVDGHRPRFEEPELWRIVAFVLATSLVGSNIVLGRWFREWERREAVPMWLIAARAATISQDVMSPGQLSAKTLQQLIELARSATERLAWDDSATYFVCLLLIDDIRQGRRDELIARLDKHRAVLERERTVSLLDHPIARYANALKHKHPLTAERIKAPVPVRVPSNLAPNPVAAADRPLGDPSSFRPINAQLADVMADLGDLIDAASKVFDLFVEMYATPPSSPRAEELMREMAKRKPADVKWVMPAWRTLVKERVPWLRRLRFEYLG